jgi:hypothetical protein
MKALAIFMCLTVPSPAPKPGRLSGTVERSGECAETSQINVCATSVGARRCQVTDHGRFSLEVPPGSYKLQAVCEQLVAEHVGELYVTAGEALDGIVVSLRKFGVVELTLQLPPGAADEDLDILSDPPSYDTSRMHPRHRAGDPLTLPIPVPFGPVHVWTRGRCLHGDLRMEMKQSGVTTRVTMTLARHPCK